MDSFNNTSVYIFCPPAWPIPQSDPQPTRFCMNLQPALLVQLLCLDCIFRHFLWKNYCSDLIYVREKGDRKMWLRKTTIFSDGNKQSKQGWHCRSFIWKIPKNRTSIGQQNFSSFVFFRATKESVRSCCDVSLTAFSSIEENRHSFFRVWRVGNITLWVLCSLHATAGSRQFSAFAAGQLLKLQYANSVPIYRGLQFFSLAGSCFLRSP